MQYRLGKLPARKNSVQFKFSSYFHLDELPRPPKHFGRYWKFPKDGWEMLANDNYSDCVWAGAAHETKLWASEGKLDVSFSDECVLADYSAVTGFVPSNPESDQGTDMAEAASYRRATGIADENNGRHKIDAYVSLKPRNLDQLKIATYLFGAVGVGIEFPAYAMDQFNAGHPWTVSSGDIDGGHYIPVFGVNPNGNFVAVTWGRAQEVTPQFISHYCDEAVAYLSLERLRKRISPDGFNYEALESDLKALA